MAKHDKRRQLTRWVLGLILVLAGGCTPETLTQPKDPSLLPAAVATADKYGTQTALSILSQGGNAVDAAIATAFVLAVTYPEAGNIGGGGFMLIHMGDTADFLDYREQAPGLATRDMFLDEQGEVIPDLSLIGHKAVGVPGTVAGLWAAHEKYGSLPWQQLLSPAIELANSHQIGQLLKGRIAEEMVDYQGKTNFAQYFGAVLEQETIVQSELADTLQRISDSGRDGFYLGETAELIEKEMLRGGGLIRKTDLAAYQPKWRDPLRVPWRDYEILTAPLPSSGGFAVIQLLKMKDHLSQEFADLEHNSSQYVHLTAEMEKRVFADRAEYLGDPDFVDVPMLKLIDDDYIERRANEVNPRSISVLENVKPGIQDGNSTTHFSIVDRWGNAVANTYTLNTWFGSGVVVEGGGFLLNNEMDDFSAKPGAPNVFGVVGFSANAIEPGKRMLSSMSPTMLLQNGQPVMVLGSPGGSTIFTSVYQAIVNILDFGMTAQQAVSVPRFHHQLLPPTEITYSVCCALSEQTIRELRSKGYDPKPHEWEFGDLQLLWRVGDTWDLGSDIRGRGTNQVLD